MKIPVKAAAEIGKVYKLDEVVIIGYKKEDNTQFVTTWGTTTEDCAVVAAFGNYIKKNILKWPLDNCEAISASVRKLKEELKSLKNRIKILENKK
jgi:methionyl-tRNA formyltransferase